MADEPKRPDFSDVPLRVRTWLYIIAALLLCLSWAPFFYVGVSLLSYGAFFEFYGMAGRRGIPWLCYPLLAALLYVYFEQSFFAFTLLSVGGALLVALCPPSRYGLLLGLVSLFSLGSLAFIFKLGGAWALLFYLLVAQLNDVFQYLSGKLFGRHALAPRISPKKTLEGFLGGLVLSCALAHLLAPWLLAGAYDGLVITLLALTLASLGLCGDLLMSAIKRHFGVKDTGTLLPGHGGLLDRVDSLTLSAPLFVLFLIDGQGGLW